MPSFLMTDGHEQLEVSQHAPHLLPPFEKQSLYIGSVGDFQKAPSLGVTNGTKMMNGTMPIGTHKGSSLQSIPLGRLSGTYSTYSREALQSRDGSIRSSLLRDADLTGRRSPGPASRLSTSAPAETGFLGQSISGRENSDETSQMMDSHFSYPQRSKPAAAFQVNGAIHPITPSNGSSNLQAPPHRQGPHRFSSPPTLAAASQASLNTISSLPQAAPQLRHRHTLQVPKLSTLRTSREFSASTLSDEADPSVGRFSPTTSGARRTSLTLGRRTTRSIHSDMYLDDIPQDNDALRWSEAIRQKRASKRRRKEEEDEDRVVVGTKVDQHHVNWVTAYNMLTGIRFTVSRTNAKLDRPLTDADFHARHKFSFDITGNELTPSAKYDFKFKDYAPWVFRHLRAKFKLDPADYLMSLTSKYILSELGSPGKSGSFFYFSRDYKYIIKTIHHAEHKFLRKILREYFEHIEQNPDTLLSQFYGLHRVKIPYGKKIHFVVMNNLFPPHRDIHRTFDLKGSTIGRDFKEEDLAKNPRATRKDLNWLRWNLHLEFGPCKKHIFLDQVERDVRLLQRLKIMDYSLLVGIHDLGRGNEENVREQTLQIFQPGGEQSEEPVNSILIRTTSKVENARKARELRQIIKNQKPIPLDQSTSKMPDELVEDRKHFAFYGDDGGFRATHEDERPGEEIYYLGIIDCLTHYSLLKKSEHFWKGLSHPKSQISAIPPEPYGKRFKRFITGITKTPEEAERERRSDAAPPNAASLDSQRPSGHLSRSSTDRVTEKGERQARRPEQDGANEGEKSDRILSSMRSLSAERSIGVAGATLPVLEEVGEAGSTSGRSREETTTHQNATDEKAGLRDSSAADSPPATGTTTMISTMMTAISTTTAVTQPDELGHGPDGSGTPTAMRSPHLSLHQVPINEEQGDQFSKTGEVALSTKLPEDLAFRLRESFYTTGPAI